VNGCKPLTWGYGRQQTDLNRRGRVRSSLVTRPAWARVCPANDQKRPVSTDNSGERSRQAQGAASGVCHDRRGRAGAADHRKTTDNTGERRSADRAGQQPFPSVRPGNAITRIVSRTEEARGSNPLTSTPNLAGQSVARAPSAALTACCGRAAAASSRHSAAGTALRDQATRPKASHHDHAAWSPPAADRQAILAHLASPIDYESMRSLLNHTHDQVEADPPLPSTACQPQAPWSNLGQTTCRCGHGRRPRRPRPSQPRDCLPTATLHDHSGRMQRTLKARTPDARPNA
jgi:hypothetical protein